MEWKAGAISLFEPNNFLTTPSLDTCYDYRPTDQSPLLAHPFVKQVVTLTVHGQLRHSMTPGPTAAS